MCASVLCSGVWEIFSVCTRYIHKHIRLKFGNSSVFYCGVSRVYVCFYCMWEVYCVFYSLCCVFR